MKILVCISKVPETTSKILFDETGKNLVDDEVQSIINPYDDWYALTRAIELVSEFGGEVAIITVGGSDDDTILRKALALGGDYGVRIDKSPINALDTAQQLAQYVTSQSEKFDLIMGGKETISYNNGMVMGMLAELLEVPYVYHVKQLNFTGEVFTIVRDVQEGEETLSCAEKMLVVSAAKGLGEQKTPNLKGIMGAKKKEIKVIPPKKEEIVSFEHRFELLPIKKECVMAESVEQLVDMLDENTTLLD